jgi:hypothetical protein
MERINFEKCPLCLDQFAILDIESKKKYTSCRRRAEKRAFSIFREEITNSYLGAGAMTKKKGKKKSKPAVKKVITKGKAKGKSKKEELNPAEVRRDISKLVEAHAQILAEAVIGEGEKGQLGPVKFLFEVANIFPPAGDEASQTSANEESFAETLLKRLGIPTDPVLADEYAKEDEEVIPAKSVLAEEKSTEDDSEKAEKPEPTAERDVDVPVGCE